MGAYIKKGGAATAPGFRMDPFDINKEVSMSKYKLCLPAVYK